MLTLLIEVTFNYFRQSETTNIFSLFTKNYSSSRIHIMCPYSIQIDLMIKQQQYKQLYFKLLMNIGLINIQMYKDPHRGTTGSNDLYDTSRFNKDLVHDNAYDKNRIQRVYQYPSDLKEALIHKKANEFGYNSKTLKDDKSAPLCPCCQLPINTVRIKLNYGTTPSKDDVKKGGEVFLLNAGSAMFFTFIKMTVVYLLLRFILSDCFNLITNSAATNCSKSQNLQSCRNNVVARFSSYNKQTNNDEPFLYIVDILNFATIICSMAFFMYYRRYQYGIYSLADISNHSQSDYTVFVENIPIFLPTNKAQQNSQIQCNYQQEMKVVFQEQINKWIGKVKNERGISNKLDASFYKLLQANPQIEDDHKVTSVSLCFDLTEMEKLNDMRENFMRQHNEKGQKDINQDLESISYIPNQIQCLNKEYIELSKKFAMENSLAFNLSHFVGKAFISFQYEYYKDYFISYFRETEEIRIQERALKISTAAQPSDIYWFNMKITYQQRRNSMIYSFLVMMLSLGFSFALLFALQYYQFTTSTSQQISAASATPKTQTYQDVILSYLFTIVITTMTIVINYLLTVVTQKLTDWERHKTKTDYIVSLMAKSIMAQFANTAVIYYIISVVSIMFLPPAQNSPLNDNGLVMKVTSLVAVSGFIQILTNTVQVGTLFSCIFNRIKYKEQQPVNMFQTQLNKQLQDPEFNFSDKYAYYIVNVYVISFFSYITPYISFILAIIFTIQYWVDKYNLFQRFSCPVDFNFRLSRFTLIAFECSIFIFALGNIIFSPTIHVTKDETEYHIINIVSLIIAFAYCIIILFLPKKWFQNVDDQDYQKTSYAECLKKEYFNKVYWHSNPATSFAEEVDINNGNKTVNYGEANEFANSSDFDRIIEAERNGDYKIQTYSAEQEKMMANIVGRVQNQLAFKIINKDEDENDIMSKFANAAKK